MPKVKPLTKKQTLAEMEHNFILLVNSIIALKDMDLSRFCEKAGINERTWRRKKQKPDTVNLEDLLKICTELDVELVIGKNGIRQAKTMEIVMQSA